MVVSRQDSAVPTEIVPDGHVVATYTSVALIVCWYPDGQVVLGLSANAGNANITNRKTYFVMLCPLILGCGVIYTGFESCVGLNAAASVVTGVHTALYFFATSSRTYPV